MRHLLITVTAALAIAGCAAERQDAEPTSSNTKQAAAASGSRVAAASSADHRAPFASRPDRGALLAYAPDRQTFRRGAHTYHAVELSEAHALNAVAAGRSISLTTPSGETLQIAYQRHEESIDGNWSWIGKTREGYDAVITFGEQAVFGRISRPESEPLRLTMAAGRVWMVETDASRMHDGDTMRTASDDDVMIPPTVAADIVAKKQAAASADAPGKASAANTVDVVLGYTNGLATRLGGTSQATTRLANLMALTNQAYANSQITPRVRLVHTLQVAYTDSNSNETALEALTGFTCSPTSCTAQTVPAELVPLRTARDTFGGDLVSLVRPLLAPQHGGCGIAWLLGGGGFAIDGTDAPFGYSIVSDGTDIDEGDGRTYNCRDESLAHELGHNMGQQHNVEDSGGDSGTHPYSYGYREASTTGFYTIMAYRLSNSSQFSINYFGNPNVNYADTGRPTGTATADNARSLNLSMPLVAQFRNAVVPFGGRARNDFNGDGKSDIVLWNPSISYLAYWIMDGSVFTGASGFTLASGTQPASTGFMSTGARASLVARNPTTLTLSTYIWNGSAFAQGIIGNYSSDWTIIGVADIDGDSKGDLLWRNPTTGAFAYWLMDGPVFRSGQTYGPPATYVVAGVGDFNGDGRSDLLWNDPGTRNASIWMSTGTGFTVSLIGQYGSDWNMVGVADVTGDGKSDILLRDNGNVYLAFWRMDGAVYQGSTAYGLAADRSLLTTGDFNGDGIEDLIITRASDRSLWLWRSNGTSFVESNIGQYGSDWSIIK